MIVHNIWVCVHVCVNPPWTATPVCRGYSVPVAPWLSELWPPLPEDKGLLCWQPAQVFFIQTCLNHQSNRQMPCSKWMIFSLDISLVHHSTAMNYVADTHSQGERVSREQDDHVVSFLRWKLLQLVTDMFCKTLYAQTWKSITNSTVCARDIHLSTRKCHKAVLVNNSICYLWPVFISVLSL